MSTNPKLSVVVCFKDWGLERLVGITESILASGLGDDLEVVVADYGSENSEGFAEALETAGARYFYYETDGVWSRSRALNLGISEARGHFVATTDADMVFTPETFPHILNLLEQDPNAYHIVQCRDLPAGITHQDVNSGSADWDKLERISRLRPRWGMGGLIAFPKAAYDLIRGLDERLVLYGGEDIDLAKRLMRAGLKRNWVDQREVRMYHIWHPSSLESAESTESGKRIVQENRRIHAHDSTTVRNREVWRGRSMGYQPLVTVAISTHNRAEFLEESLGSVFAQSFRDFEVVVVDDGSTDNTKEVLGRFTDPRLRVYHQPNKGLAAARNFITKVANGRYIAVHDDDDIMLPTRLSDQLAVLLGGVNGTYGGWVNFDAVTGELDWNRGKKFSLESLAFNKGIYLHPTLMIEREILSLVPYDESMRSGSDYNLAVRLARAGVNLEHCGQFVMLRRLHPGQITNEHGIFQKVSGRVSGGLARTSFSRQELEEAKTDRPKKDWTKVDLDTWTEERISHYLPDNLSSRVVEIVLEDVKTESVGDLSSMPHGSFLGRRTTTAGSAAFYRSSEISLVELFELHSRFGSRVRTFSVDEDDSEPKEVAEFEELMDLTLQQVEPGQYEILEFVPALDAGFTVENLSDVGALTRVDFEDGNSGKTYLVIKGFEEDLDGLRTTATNRWTLERKLA